MWDEGEKVEVEEEIRGRRRGGRSRTRTRGGRGGGRNFFTNLSHKVYIFSFIILSYFSLGVEGF